MKILAISNYYPEHQGGIEFVAMNLVKWLRQRHEVHWLAATDARNPHRASVDDLQLHAWNAAEERLGFPYPIPTPAAFRRIAEQVAWCDVVHLHDCLYISNLAAFASSRRLRRPCMITQHVGAIPYRQVYKNVLQQWAYGTAGKWVLENAEQVIFISERVREWFRQRIRFGAEPLLLENGVDRELFHPARPGERGEFRKELGLSTDEVVCLFVGRFTEKKGLSIIRRLAEARPAWHWLLIGSGEIKPREWGLENIRVIESQSQESLRRYYIAADLLLLPSVGEGFPLVVQEALTCGLPAAVSEEIAERVPDAPLHAMNPTTLPMALHVLDNLLEGDVRVRRLRAEAAAYSRRWDWETVAQEYEHCMLKLASARIQ